jgi:Uma2 family endonuclease
MVLQSKPVTTAEDFDTWIALAENKDRHFEFINGEVVEKMASKHRHTAVTMRICSRITIHLETHNLPGYTTGETGGFAFGSRRYLPDCAYVDSGEPGDQIYSDIPPVLVIEVVSDPTSEQEMRHLRNKREDYLKGGATVWEVYPDDALVDIYTPDGRYRTERDSLTFDGLPRLETPLASVFR